MKKTGLDDHCLTQMITHISKVQYLKSPRSLSGMRHEEASIGWRKAWTKMSEKEEHPHSEEIATRRREQLPEKVVLRENL